MQYTYLFNAGMVRGIVMEGAYFGCERPIVAVIFFKPRTHLHGRRKFKISKQHYAIIALCKAKTERKVIP